MSPAPQNRMLPSPSPPSYQPFWLRWSTPIALTFILVAVGSEVLYHYSLSKQGFYINLFHLSESRSVQFLKSFLPSLLFNLLVWLYANVYDTIRTMQPYLAISKGNAAAEDSVLVSYPTKGTLGTLWEAMLRGHRSIFIAALFSLSCQIYGPLGGAYFNIAPVNISQNASVAVSNPVDPSGLFGASDLGLDPFGYMVYSAPYGLSYPPTMFRDPQDNTSAWSIAPFWLNSTTGTPVTNPINGTQILHVPNVPAVRIHAECKPATNAKFEPGAESSFPDGGPELAGTMIAVLGDSCTSQLLVNRDLLPIADWMGNTSYVEPTCITAINPTTPNPSSLDESQYPLATLFFHNQTTMSAVFCYATYEMYTLTAELDVVSSGIIPQIRNASLIQGYFVGQNYTFTPTSFSNLTFSDVPLPTLFAEFLLVRALGNGVSLVNSIPSDAGPGDDLPNMNVLSDPALAVGFVRDAYLLYQTLMTSSMFASIASGWFFINGTYSYQTNRLVVFGPTAHAIAALTGTTGLTLLLIFFIHSSERRQIESSEAGVVAKPAASIAALGAMLSEADALLSGESDLTSERGFLDCLSPTDMDEQLEKKLADWKFSLTPDGRIIGRRVQDI